jgi:hypothetical protein
MRVKAVSALAEEFDRTHEDPQADADRWITRLMRSGWRPVPSLLDHPSSPPARSRVARERLAEARQVVEGKRGNRPELAAETAGGER